MKKTNRKNKKREFKKAFVAATLMASLFLTGCGNYKDKASKDVIESQEALLKDTFFEDVIVASVCDNANALDRPVFLIKMENVGLLSSIDVYFDKINGEYISISNNFDDVRRVSNITPLGTVFEYLSEEDIEKLRNKEFTEEDENRVLSQIRDELIEKREENAKKIKK